MLRKFELRHPAVIIFIFSFLLTIIYLRYDLKKIEPNQNVKDKIVTVKEVRVKNSSVTIYCEDTVINLFFAKKKYKAGDVLKVSGLLTDNRAENKGKKIHKPNLYTENKYVITSSAISYNLYLKSKGYDYTLKANKIEKIGYKSNPYIYILKIRENLNKTIDRIYFKHNGILRALITADRGFINSEQRVLYQLAGINHLISISGFHIIVFSGIFFSLLFFLPVKSRYFTSAALTFFYVALIGFAGPCVRAYIFYITYIASIYLNKKYDVYSIGFLLSTVYMILNPYILFDAGFSLSLLSVFSIAMFYSKIYKFFTRKMANKYIKAVFALISMTISAQVLTFVYVAVVFKGVATYSILTNLIAVPLVSFSYPFLISSIFLYPIPFLSKILANIVNAIYDFFYFSMEKITGLPFSYVEFTPRAYYLISVYTFAILAIYFYSTHKIIRRNLVSLDK